MQFRDLPKKQRGSNLIEMIELWTASNDVFQMRFPVTRFFQDLYGYLAHLNFWVVQLCDKQPDSPFTHA